MGHHKGPEPIEGTSGVAIPLIAKTDNDHLLATEINFLRTIEEQCMHVRIELPLDAACVPRPTAQEEILPSREIIRFGKFRTLTPDNHLRLLLT